MIPRNSDSQSRKPEKFFFPFFFFFSEKKEEKGGEWDEAEKCGERVLCARHRARFCIFVGLSSLSRSKN